MLQKLIREIIWLSHGFFQNIYFSSPLLGNRTLHLVWDFILPHIKCSTNEAFDIRNTAVAF